MDMLSRSPSTGFMIGGPIVSVMPHSWSSCGPNRSPHSSSCAGVTFWANSTTRSGFDASSGRRGCASSIRMGAANRLDAVHRWAMAWSK